MNTAFDPSVHGFGFRNRFAGSHVIAELARQDRIAEIIGIDVPGPLRSALGLASHAEFWDGFGLCGGMAWASLDNFEADRISERETDSAAPGTPLFTRLVTRQADSFQRTRLIARLLEWSALPSSSAWWGFWMDSVGRRVTNWEWPLLRASLDGGRPRALCLMRSKRLDQISRNHQVVAIGYTEDAGRISLSLYDPNHPGDTPTITFTTTSFLNRIEIVQSTGEPIVGFFVWPPDDTD